MAHFALKEAGVQVLIPAGLLPVLFLFCFFVVVVVVLFFSFIVFLLFGLFLFILSDNPF